MLGHVHCPQSDHDHDHPTTTTATQLRVVCTANHKHADDNDRNDAAPNKHADDEHGSMTGDDCANNDCNLKTVTTSRGTLPTRWRTMTTTTTTVAGSPHAATLLDFLSSHAPAQLRSKAIYALSGLLKHHTATLALFEAAGRWAAFCGALSGNTARFPAIRFPMPDTTTIRAGSGSTDSEADAGPCVHPNSHAALVADPGSVDSTSELSATTSTIMLVTTSAGP
ncbi:hypothetical protein EDB85DRAFT_2150672 [Lactarius pseudohatsudake]|nr:hypothetical protein EDB85DRAFT_2150672 [Lactarius pseudohatsudake]